MVSFYNSIGPRTWGGRGFLKERDGIYAGDPMDVCWGAKRFNIQVDTIIMGVRTPGYQTASNHGRRP